MKAKMIFMALLAVFLTFACQKKNSTEPADENIHPQQDIPWPSLADSPWPIVHGNAQCTGRSKFKGPREGKVLWTFSENEFIFEESGIVIGEDNTIYFTARIRKPERHHYLYAINPDGTLKWKRKLGDVDSYSPTPLIGTNNLIYVIQQNGHFNCFDSNGNQKRDKGTSTSNYTFGAVIDLNENFYFADVQGTIYALSKDGTLKWTTDLTNSGYIPFTYSMALSLDATKLYAPSLDSTIKVIEPLTGNVLNEYKLGHNFLDSSPIIDASSNIYFIIREEGKGYLIRSMTPDGQDRWKSDRNVGYMASMCMDNEGNIYAYSGNLELISFDYNGNFRWKIALPNSDIKQWSTSIIVDVSGVVYISMPSQYVLAFDKNGNQIFNCQLPDISDWLIMGAISKNGNLYLASKYQVYCVK